MRWRVTLSLGPLTSYSLRRLPSWEGGGEKETERARGQWMGGVAPGQIWEKTVISLQPTVHVSTSNELSRHSSPDVVHAVCFHGNDTTLATLSPITDDD